MIDHLTRICKNRADMVQIRKDRVAKLQALFPQGGVAEFEVADAVMALDSAQIDLEQADMALEKAKAELEKTSKPSTAP